MAGQRFSSAYTKMRIQHKNPAVEGFNCVWNNWVTRTVNIFYWRALHKSLPTCDSLLNLNVPLQSSMCKFYEACEEDVDHLFTSCDLVTEVWAKIGPWCNIQPVFAFTFKDIMELPYLLSRDVANFKKSVHAVFVAITWTIWKYRNSVLFEGVKPSPLSVICEVRVMASLWLIVRSRNDRGMILNNFPYDPD